MLIISQNATDYDLNFPKDAILRINLEWCNSLDELEIILKKNSDYGIFIDLPIGRLKPPNNRYTLNEIIPILKNSGAIVMNWKNGAAEKGGNILASSNKTLHYKILKLLKPLAE